MPTAPRQALGGRQFGKFESGKPPFPEAAPRNPRLIESISDVRRRLFSAADEVNGPGKNAPRRCTRMRFDVQEQKNGSRKHSRSLISAVTRNGCTTQRRPGKERPSSRYAKKPRTARPFHLEGMTGIEPASLVWKTKALPLSYIPISKLLRFEQDSV